MRNERTLTEVFWPGGQTLFFGQGVRLCSWFLAGDEKPKTKFDPETLPRLFGHGQAIGALMHGSAPWKTEETIVGLLRLLALPVLSRFGGCHLSAAPSPFTRPSFQGRREPDSRRPTTRLTRLRL